MNIEEAVINLCKTYIKDRKLPDIGIDLGDETLAALSNFKTSIPNLVDWINDNLSKIDKMSSSEVDIFVSNLKNKITLAVLQRIESKINFESELVLGPSKGRKYAV